MDREPHVGHLALVWHAGRGELHIVDLRIDEVALVSRTNDHTLHYGEAGNGFVVDPAGRAKWVSDFLAREVCRLSDSAAKVVVPDVDGNVVLWRDFMARHQVVSVTLKMRGAGDFEITCLLFSRRHAGAFLWWSCRSVHGRLHMSGPPNKWYSRHWNAWQSHLLKVMKLGAPHCRRAKETAHCKEQQDTVGTTDYILERVVGEPSLSTWAFVSLALRWACGGRGSATEATADSWRAIFKGIVDTWVLSGSRTGHLGLQGR